MNRLFLQPAFLISSVFMLALVAGGVYVSIRIHDDEVGKDQLVKKAEQLATGHASAEQIAAELAQARIEARKELERLNLLTNYPTSAEALAAVRQEVYEQVLIGVLARVDAVVGDLAGVNPTSAQQNIERQIVAEQEHIRQLLEEWKQLVSNSSLNSNPAAATQASQFAAEIKQDIQDLKHLTEQLTPENSGLSPAEITADQTAIDNAIAEAHQAVSNLSQTTVPPSIVQQQQQTVTNAQNTVTQLQQNLQQTTNPPAGSSSGQNSTPPPGTNTGGGSPGDASASDTTSSLNSSDPNYQAPLSPNYPGTRYVPPVVSPDPNKPKLIEGQNPNQ